jgi:Tfp pilus assembly protein PilF
MSKESLRGSPRVLVSVVMLVATYASGCVSKPGTRPSIWPTQTITGSGAGSMTQALSKTASSMKSQIATVGTAMSSAYTKTKTAITTPFTTVSTATPAENTSSSAKPVTVAPEILVAQGSYFESQGNYAKAMDSYSRALEVEAKNPAALLSMARLYDQQKDSTKSIEFYRKAIDVAPNHADAYAELGNLHARSGNLKEARNELLRAVNLQPKNRSYRASLAGVLLDSGDTDAAFDELRQTDAPAMAHYQLAYLHFNRKNIPATQQQLNLALQIDPNLKPARDLLASMGGAQNVTNMVQQSQRLGQQAMGVYQAAGNLLGDGSPSTNGFSPTPPLPTAPTVDSSSLSVPYTGL